MINRRKYIFDYLSENERDILKNDLQNIQQIANSTFFRVNSSTELVWQLRNIVFDQPSVIQIISHGDYDKFGIDTVSNFVKYTELAQIFRDINRVINNELILNLTTVCFSAYQLSFFNKSEQKLFKFMIGSLRNSGTNGAIKHSIDIYGIDMSEIKNRIDIINENSDSDPDCNVEVPETCLYWIE